MNEKRYEGFDRHGLDDRHCLHSGRLPAGWRRQRPVKIRGSVLADLRAERESGW